MRHAVGVAAFIAVFWTLLPPASVAQLPMPASGADTLPVESASASITGRIEGVVTMSPKLSEGRMRFRPYGDFGQGQFPAQREAPADHFANVVVYLVSSALSSDHVPPQEGHLTITQADEDFAPHVLPVLRGSTVEFPNDDDIYHNVFSFSGPASFDLGRYPRGESKSVRFDRAGVVSLFCHIHSDMSAMVLVLDNPFFAKPDAEGRFSITGIPPGEHTLVLWHERMRPMELNATVVAGETMRLEAHLPFPLEPGVH